MLQVADTLAASLSNAPLAEADIRFSIGGGYSGVLYDFPSSEPQFARAEYCSSLAGPAGERIFRLARSHRTGSLMWENQDTNANQALRDIAKEALSQKPPNTELAAQALSNLALFQSYFDRDHPTIGEATALEVLQIAPDDWLHLPYRTVALDVAMRMLVLRNEFAEADKLASQLIATLPLPRGSDGYQKAGIISTFVKTISAGGRFAKAEATVQSLTKNLPKDDTVAFDILTAFHGDIVARGGDWVRGLALISSSATNVVCPIELWSESVSLAALLNERDLHRALITTGLIRWAGGADTENVPKLVEPLLAVPPDDNLLPVIRELVDRSLKGSPWTRNHGQQLTALLAYRTGQYSEAARSINDFHKVAPEMLSKGGVEPVVASGWFTRALIEARLGHPDAARDAYREGQKLHSPALRHSGNSYTGDYFESACAAELLRREAAALLGEATPPDTAPAGKP